MRCKIIAVGTKPPAWVKTAVDDYSKRFPPDFKLNFVEIKAAQRNETNNAERWMQQEAVAIEAALPDRHHLVILDERGKDITTRQLASRMEHWAASGLETVIVIGGPDGLASSLKDKANETIRLSSLTLPHALVRVLLLEQLFRARSVIDNHPYHRD